MILVIVNVADERISISPSMCLDVFHVSDSEILMGVGELVMSHNDIQL